MAIQFEENGYDYEKILKRMEEIRELLNVIKRRLDRIEKRKKEVEENANR